MDTNSLNRFLEVQEHSYARSLDEIKAGKKLTHWMWFVFPQLRGLGKSTMSYIYGINGIEEAERYLAHPVLSARLIEISEALLTHKEKSALDILGYIDSMKLQSSMTLFAQISDKDSVFRQVLVCFFNVESDEQTLKLITKI